MVRQGLRLPPDLLALACGSHDGTARHVDAARRILATAGLDETSLGNPADLPLDRATAEDVLRGGGTRTRLQMNCSGKHGGMLVTSSINGWPVDLSYLTSEHPLQQRVTETVDDLAEEQCNHIGVDGCGLPAHVISLVGLARAYRAIAMAAADDADSLVYTAMTTHPEMVGGEGRDVTKFMRHIPGLMAKDGAEGVYAAALPDGRAVALKIADGGNRARPAVMVAALRTLGVDTSAVEPLVVESLLGHGRPVGEVRAIAP
jgi:L-asparaginase II